MYVSARVAVSRWVLSIVPKSMPPTINAEAGADAAMPIEAIAVASSFFHVFLLRF